MLRALFRFRHCKLPTQGFKIIGWLAYGSKYEDLNTWKLLNLKNSNTLKMLKKYIKSTKNFFNSTSKQGSQTITFNVEPNAGTTRDQNMSRVKKNVIKFWTVYMHSYLKQKSLQKSAKK